MVREKGNGRLLTNNTTTTVLHTLTNFLWQSTTMGMANNRHNGNKPKNNSPAISNCNAIETPCQVLSSSFINHKSSVLFQVQWPWAPGHITTAGVQDRSAKDADAWQTWQRALWELLGALVVLVPAAGCHFNYSTTRCGLIRQLRICFFFRRV